MNIILGLKYNPGVLFCWGVWDDLPHSFWLVLFEVPFVKYLNRYTCFIFNTPFAGVPFLLSFYSKLMSIIDSKVHFSGAAKDESCFLIQSASLSLYLRNIDY